MLPKFHNKEDGTNNGYETIQDFFLSWTLRCAEDNDDNDYKSSLVQEYARRIIYILIYGDNNNVNEYYSFEKDYYSSDKEIPVSFKVIKVRTTRQERSIDLLAHIVTNEKNENGENKKYVFNIENKWYQRLSNGQLEKYDKYVTEKYPDEEKVNLFITYDYREDNEAADEAERKQCIKNGYKYLTIQDLSLLSKMEKDGRTGNALFDEYWFNF